MKNWRWFQFKIQQNHIWFRWTKAPLNIELQWRNYFYYIVVQIFVIDLSDIVQVKKRQNGYSGLHQRQQRKQGGKSRVFLSQIHAGAFNYVVAYKMASNSERSRMLLTNTIYTK